MTNSGSMIWGKATWMLFHTIAEQIDDNFYKANYVQLYNLIKRICLNLPCRTCAGHATEFMSSVHPNSINTREKFKAMLFYFHNKVNGRVKKPLFKQSDLAIYGSYNIRIVLSNFITFYGKRYNQVLQSGLLSTETMRRRICSDVLNLIKTYNQYFIRK